MTSQNARKSAVDERLAMRSILLLALLPGAMSVAGSLLLAPLVVAWGAPPLLARFLGNALFIGLFELGYLLWRGKRLSGRYSLAGVVGYRERLPWWQYVLWVVILIVWGMAAATMLAPLSASLRDTAFSWMPALFTADPAALDPSLYARGGLVATVVVGIVFTGIVIPVAEELYYRGYLLPRMEWLGWLAPALNVGLWGLNHFFEPWQIILFVVTFAPVGYVVRWKRNVYLGMAAHVLANLAAVLPMLGWLATGAS